MYSTETIAAIVVVARESGIEPAALLAICHVESGGKVFAKVGGRLEPMIRFEGHYFDRRLSGSKRRRARAEGLAAARAGAVANPATQAGRWALLREAEAIDRQAARESVSWGLGQVMGAHWAWLGYASVDALVEEARDGADGQARLMVRYIRKAGLMAAIRAHDWAKFAHGYNGPAYRKYRYDTKIAAAYKRFLKSTTTEPANGDGDGKNNDALKRGAKGSKVADLQRNLAALGSPLAIDGDFGPATEDAVRRFQSRHGLAATGIADKATLGAIGKALPLSGGGSLFLDWLAKLVARLFGRV
ncbi:MAG: N-acetylmuramidase domain-containing protein [Rhizobiaceae bacterium]